MVSAQPVLTHPFVLYQSTLLTAYANRLIHGFTGKPVTLGGPQGPDERIWANRRLVCEQAGLATERLILPRQTHSACYRLNDIPFEDGADAVILTETGIPAMVQVADCVPIILYDPDCHVGAVIHAGWRGTAQAITPQLVQALTTQHGATASSLRAVIGPSIGGCCYEVSNEVSEAMQQTLPHPSPERYQVMQANGKPRIDLKQVNRLQLQALGVKHIEILDACTRCESESLWSYRRGEDGRQVAFLQLLP